MTGLSRSLCSATATSMRVMFHEGDAPGPELEVPHLAVPHLPGGSPTSGPLVPMRVCAPAARASRCGVRARRTALPSRSARSPKPLRMVRTRGRGAASAESTTTARWGARRLTVLARPYYDSFMSAGEPLPLTLRMAKPGSTTPSCSKAIKAPFGMMSSCSLPSRKTTASRTPKVSRHEMVDGNHGRIETKNDIAIHEGPKSGLQERHDWPGLKGTAMVESTREIDDKVERRDALLHHFPADAGSNQLGPVIRSHWAVENPYTPSWT